MTLSRIIGLAVVGLLAEPACERQCEPSLDPTAKYQVAVLDVYNAQSQYYYDWMPPTYPDSGTCSGIDGLVPGASLNVQATGRVSNPDGTCYEVTAQVLSGPSELGLVGWSSDEVAGDEVRGTSAFMYSVESVTAGGCAGSWALGYYNGGGPGGIFAAPVAGKLPPAIVWRLFLPSTPSCQPCEDDFAIQLTKE